MNSGSDQIIALYRRHAQAWARDRADQRMFETPWLDRFRALIPAGGSILDLGCGAGSPIASYLIQNGCGLTGVDSAPEMIAMCTARFPNQDWQVGDMRTLALPRKFDGILAWDSFFHLNHEDQRAMFPIFRAHAAPGAALMFTSGTSHGTAMGLLHGDPLYHASLDPEEYRALLAANGFELIAHLAEDPECGHRTIWLAQVS